MRKRARTRTVAGAGRALLRFLAQPQAQHLASWVIALLLGIFLTLASFMQLRDFESERARITFTSRADSRLRTLDANITRAVDKLRALGGYFDATEYIDAEHFARLAGPLVSGDTAIQAVEWIPNVPADLRPAVEAVLRHESGVELGIREKDASGAMVRAGERLNYFPVEYVEPVRGNEKALGFDLASNPARREALEAAARLGQLSATARISLVQETGDQFGLLIFRPVFRAGVRDAKALRGYVLGVFRVGNMLGSDEGPISDGVHVALFDLDGHPGERLLYPKARSRDWDRVQDIAYDHILERGLVVGGRGWKAVAYVPAGAGTAERWLSSSALVAGLMLSILLAAYLRLSTRHRQRIEAEVAERTADLERTQSELIVAKNAAEAGSRAKSNFLATVSHELRTPMNGVIGFAELLLLPGIGEAQQQEYAGTILSSSRVLLSLLDDILDLSKIEAGKMQLMVTELEPERKLREMSAIFLESARRKGLALEAIWSGPPGARYLGDAIRVRQMLANLINNAIKFTDIGGVRVEGNELACDERGAMLEFSVMDTGIGIAPEKIELLFRPFSQIGEFEAGTTKGTGLGLSIVRKLARMMGGDAGVQSTPGKGSRFWIRIRVQMSPNTELEGPRTRSRSKLLEF